MHKFVLSTESVTTQWNSRFCQGLKMHAGILIRYFYALEFYTELVGRREDFG